MESIWQSSANKVEFKSLGGKNSTEVLIIGGGIAGILCAYKLKKAGVDCILLEAKEICSGVTEKTTAKISLAHGLIYDKIMKNYGEERALLYLQAQIKAGQEYAALCENIDCDYEKRDSYIYTLTDPKKIDLEAVALSRLGVKSESVSEHELPFPTANMIRVKNQAQFNPMKFIYEISKNLPIYEYTKALEFKNGRVITNRGEIEYKKLIIATHFPIINKHGAYFLKLYQDRSYVIALENAPKVDGMYIDESGRGLSFRSYGNTLLLGGGAHRTGKKGGCWQELEDFAKKHYKNAKIVGRWATQDCMTLDGIPYIGLYSKSTPDIFVATGFNKWGMTNSMVAADILCDLVQEKSNPYTSVFSPSRSVLHPQLLINAVESTIGLITPTVPRCPHLGCALKYNRAEHSWDCPCHGSRFTERGELIDNPATDDKKMK